jgi:hypothetical protein
MLKIELCLNFEIGSELRKVENSDTFKIEIG